LNIIKSLLSKATNFNLPLKLNPLIVKKEVPPADIRHYISTTDMNTLITFAEKTTYSIRNKAILIFLYESGCLIGEAASILVENVDFINRKIRLTSKLIQIREIPMSDKLSEELESYVQIYRLKSTSLLFPKNPNITSQQIAIRTLEEMIKKIIDQTKSNKCSALDLRYSYAINQLLSGYSLIDLSYWMDINLKVASKYLIAVEKYKVESN
jgi:site-specific recombinase XerD